MKDFIIAFFVGSGVVSWYYTIKEFIIIIRKNKKENEVMGS